jgi:hypothetical protein
MIRAEKMQSIAPGNPFLSDVSNMGVSLGKNVMAMMSNHRDQHMDWVILVNMQSGERILVRFSDNLEIEPNRGLI